MACATAAARADGRESDLDLKGASEFALRKRLRRLC
jgi:hypothetical protein